MSSAIDIVSFRFVVRFMLEFLQAGAAVHGGDYDRGVIFMLIFHANVESVTADESLDLAYSWSLIPDDLRRPVSAHALAMELGMPRETVRRRVNELIGQGACRRVGPSGGLIVPAEYFTRPEVLVTQLAVIDSFFKMALRMRAIGLPWPEPPAAPHASLETPQAAPLALAGRQIMGLALRILTLSIRALGGLDRNVVMAAIEDANVAPYADDRAVSWRYGGETDEPAPNAIKAPIMVGEVSRALGIPLSTTHRLVRGLVKDGLVIRVPGGLIVPNVVAKDERIARWRAAIHAHLNSTLKRMVELGFNEDYMIAWGKARTAGEPTSP